MLKIVHPIHVVTRWRYFGTIEGRRFLRLSEELTQPGRQLVERALARLPEMPEWIEPTRLARKRPAWAVCTRAAHKSEERRRATGLPMTGANGLARCWCGLTAVLSQGTAAQGDGSYRDKLQCRSPHWCAKLAPSPRSRAICSGRPRCCDCGACQCGQNGGCAGGVLIALGQVRELLLDESLHASIDSAAWPHHRAQVAANRTGQGKKRAESI
jgi:hypothetical protein